MVGFGTVVKVKNKKAVNYVLRHMTGLRKVINLVNGILELLTKLINGKAINQV